MANKYGVLVKTMWFTSFYTCIFPFGIFCSLINVSVTYFLDKYLFLRFYKRPPLISALLNREMVESLEYCPFLMSLGSLFFHVLLYDSSGVELFPDFLAIVLTSINFIFPAWKFNDLFCNLEQQKSNEKFPLYDEAKKRFPTVK